MLRTRISHAPSGAASHPRVRSRPPPAHGRLAAAGAARAARPRPRRDRPRPRAAPRSASPARVLYVTAHPDDEHNGVLVRLVARPRRAHRAPHGDARRGRAERDRPRAVRRARRAAHGRARLAMHRYDGVEQYFGRAYEFGFSFSVEETFAKWGREETLGDVVRVVRALPSRRDPRRCRSRARAAASTTSPSASSRATPSAPRPTRRASRISCGRAAAVAGAQDLRRRGRRLGRGARPARRSACRPASTTRCSGMTWQQLGSRARAMHRCQGARQIADRPAARPRASSRSSTRSRSSVTGSRERDVLDGIDTSLGRPRALRAGPRAARRARCAALQAKRRGRARGVRPARARRAPPVPHRRGSAAPRALRAEPRRARRRRRRARAEIEARLARRGGGRRDGARARPGPRARRARRRRARRRPGRRSASRSRCERPPSGRVEVDGRSSWRRRRGWTVERRDGELGRRAGRRPSPRALHRHRRPRRAAVAALLAARSSDRDRHELLVPADETLPWSPPAVVARARAPRRRRRARPLRAPVVVALRGARRSGARGATRSRWCPQLSVRLSPEVAAGPARRPPRPLELRVSVRSYARSAGERPTVRLEAARGLRAPPRGARRCVRRRGRGGGRALPRDAAGGGLAAGHARRARGRGARRPREPRRRAGDRLRPRRAPASCCVRREARLVVLDVRTRARRVPSATSWARATRSPTRSASSACR